MHYTEYTAHNKMLTPKNIVRAFFFSITSSTVNYYKIIIFQCKSNKNQGDTPNTTTDSLNTVCYASKKFNSYGLQTLNLSCPTGGLAYGIPV